MAGWVHFHWVEIWATWVPGLDFSLFFFPPLVYMRECITDTQVMCRVILYIYYIYMCAHVCSQECLRERFFVETHLHISNPHTLHLHMWCLHICHLHIWYLHVLHLHIFASSVCASSIMQQHMWPDWYRVPTDYIARPPTLWHSGWQNFLVCALSKWNYYERGEFAFRMEGETAQFAFTFCSIY